MLDRFKQSMVQLGDIDPTRPFLVGVSGGADSLSLLFLLHSAGYKVIAAYFDHNLRPESKDEARYVAEIADRQDIPFVSGENDVLLYAERHGLTVEAAGRALRYQFLFAQAHHFSARAVVVAHHADDQVETVLLHLLRGSGMQGLKGMSSYWIPNPWSAVIPLIRPLLNFWKSELESYLLFLGVQPMQDLTNQDPTYLRNRLRHEVLPVLEEIQPGLRPSLLRLSKIVQEEQRLLEPLVESSWQACLRRQGKGFVIMSTSALQALPVGLLRRVCRQALSILRPGLPDIDFSAVEKMVVFIQSPSRSNQLDLVAGLRLLLEADNLWLAGWDVELSVDSWPQMPSPKTHLPLQVPGSLDLPGGWNLNCSLEENAPLAESLSTDNVNPFEAWLDLDECGTNLTLRSRWEGARLQPLGLNGKTQKVSDRMIDAHLPARARRLWPLLCSDDLILWIPGLVVAHPARLTGQTRRVIHLLIKRIDGF